MNFSIETISDAGKLLISPKAMNLHYIGDAAYSGPGSSEYTSYFSINCAYRPLVFAGMGYGDSAAILDVSQSGSTWFIEVLGYCTPMCFAPLTSEPPRSAWGARILKEGSGQVAFDSTRNPLFLTHVSQQFYPAGTPLSSMKVGRPSGLISPIYTAYASAMTFGPNPPVDDSGHPQGYAGIYMTGIEDQGDGYAPIWMTYRDGSTGGPANTIPSDIVFTMLFAESNGIEP